MENLIEGEWQTLVIHEFDAQLLLNEMIPIVCCYHISFSYFFALKVVRGPEFCVKLKMFPAQFYIIGQMDKKNEMTVRWGQK